MKIFLILGVLVISVYLVLIISLRLWQTRLIFVPSSVIQSTPRDINLIYEEVWLSVDEQKLNAWWIESSQPYSPVLLYLHGNGSNLGDLVEVGRFFHNLGISILLIDYRGYGHSQGNFPDEKSVYEDAEVAWKYLVEERKIPAQNIFVYGSSLGGAIAIELAKREPQMAGVIIEASFTSIKEIADYRMPWLIVFPKWLFLTQYFDSITKVKSLQVPLLFIYGSADEVIPPYMSENLFKASSEPKYILMIPNAGHNNIQQYGGEKYRQTLLTFLKKS